MHCAEPHQKPSRGSGPQTQRIQQHVMEVAEAPAGISMQSSELNLLGSQVARRAFSLEMEESENLGRE
jgi:hypothetical protein